MKMKKRYVWMLLTFGILLGCGILIFQKSYKVTSVRALYIPVGENQHLMIDQDTKSVFTVTMPKTIISKKGKKITWQDLKRGNIVEIYGDGIMLESYPGQYPGVTKIKVVEEGNPSDANQYENLINQIYPQKNAAELPNLNVEYTQSYGTITAVTELGGYSWTYTDSDGMSQNKVADSPAITLWGDLLPFLQLENECDMNLRFDLQPQKVTATAYSATLIGKENSGDGENVLVELAEDGNLILKNAQKGMLYLIHGEWEGGWAEYGFQVK